MTWLSGVRKSCRSRDDASSRLSVPAAIASELKTVSMSVMSSRPAPRILARSSLRGPLVAEGGHHLGLGGIAQVDDVGFTVAQQVDDVAFDGVCIAMGKGHVGHAFVLVVLVADDDRDGVRIAHLAQRHRSGK